MSDDKKRAAAEKAMAEVDKMYGVGTTQWMNAKPNMEVRAISTGCIAIDEALGVGGLPLGRIIEIYGPESSGKTTLATHVVAEAQKLGGLCAYVDTEHAIDPVYMTALGVNFDNVVISQPETAEQALEVVDKLTRSGAFSVIVVDSVAALAPRAEIEGEMGDSHVGLIARLMGQALRKIKGAAAETGTMIIFINQLRHQIGIMFGNPETTPGGRALRFYASVRLDIRKTEQIKSSDGEITGSKTKVKVVKNKVSPPFRLAEFDIMYGTGISKAGALLDVAVREGVLTKSGAWFVYNGDNIGQGREKAKVYLEENPEVFAEIDAKTRALLV